MITKREDYYILRKQTYPDREKELEDIWLYFPTYFRILEYPNESPNWVTQKQSQYKKSIKNRQKIGKIDKISDKSKKSKKSVDKNRRKWEKSKKIEKNGGQ